jgi:hypothetical protein
VEVHGSARRHGITDDDIAHAVDHPRVVVDLEPEADPPKLLVIGPDRAGNLVEVILLSLAGNRTLAIHAMRLRRQYRALLPRGESEHG